MAEIEAVHLFEEFSVVVSVVAVVVSVVVAVRVVTTDVVETL